MLWWKFYQSPTNNQNPDIKIEEAETRNLHGIF